MRIIAARNASAWTGPEGNNTYLLPGALPTLVDAGVGAAEHVRDVEDALAGVPLARVLLTHGHKDHASGLPILLERWPTARAASLAGGAAVTDILADGMRVGAGDDLLLVVATPGHAPDHACFLNESSGDLFCGDLVRADGSILVAASKGGDMRAYLDSLERVRALEPRRLLPGHGPVITRPARVIDTFVRHRLEREQQVLGAMGGSSRTAEDVAAALYQGLPASLVDAAVDTVRAHLIKLCDEGRVTQAGDRWARTGR